MSDYQEEELFDSFLSESAELVADLESDVIALEQDPNSKETIDNIFRYMHSLKGNCSLFGLADIKHFFHKLESFTDKIRNREMDASTEVINILLKSTDHVKDIINRLAESIENSQLLPEEESFMQKVEALTSEEQGGDEEALRGALFSFLARTGIAEELETNEPLNEIVDIIRHHHPALLQDKQPKKRGVTVTYLGTDVTEWYIKIFEIVDEVDTGNYSETQYPAITEAVEAMIAAHKSAGQDEPVALLNELLSEMELFYQDETGFDEILSKVLEDTIEIYRENLTIAVAGQEPEKDEQKQQETSEADKQPKAEKTKGGSALKRQIKVDQAKLDKAIDMVGELVTISEFFNYIQGGISVESRLDKGRVKSLKDATITLQEVSELLSRELYDIRKVPMTEATAKLHRIVRDTQVELGKSAKLNISGDEMMVDKGLVPKLETIFVHMVRNSLDHGMEFPDDRVEAGKPEHGTISLSIQLANDMMQIEIIDDGRGINPDKVREKVRSVGIVDSNSIDAMSDQEVVELILMPGMSTSEQVTETSGRGVGMDIVASYIHEMGGSIAIASSVGEGTTITLRFPLAHTTLVKKGLAVSVGKSVLLIPIEVVLESFRLDDNTLSTVRGTEEVIRRRNEIFKVIRIYDLLNIAPAVTNPKEGIMVMVHHKTKRACLMVDSILGQRQIIYKDLGIETLKKPSPYEGISVYDGSRLAMILDVNGIMEQSEAATKQPEVEK